MFQMSRLIMKSKFLLLILSFFSVTGIFAASPKSPHGENFKKDCAICHTADNWNKIKRDGFNHNKTNFPLVGQHKAVNCRKCHTSLVFSKAPTGCSACHTDLHEGTVGKDCARCHTSNSWIVTNIRQIHQQQGFPLVGEHASADCNRCHTSASLLRFNNIRSDCYSCHQYQYEITAKPNHKMAGFGIDCERCHNMVGRSWNSIGNGFDHSIFPLTGGHNIPCQLCHTDNNYQKKVSSDCLSCHSEGVAITLIPAHATKMTKYTCSDCHNNISWNNVRFQIHDSWFGIYSGRHRGVWTKCTDCHNNDATYKSNCRKCHNFDN